MTHRQTFIDFYKNPKIRDTMNGAFKILEFLFVGFKYADQKGMLHSLFRSPYLRAP